MKYINLINKKHLKKLTTLSFLMLTTSFNANAVTVTSCGVGKILSVTTGNDSDGEAGYIAVKIYSDYYNQELILRAKEEFNLNTAVGKGMYSMLLLAQASGKEVNLGGTSDGVQPSGCNMFERVSMETPENGPSGE